mgnify:CR=1 FL=1
MVTSMERSATEGGECSKAYKRGSNASDVPDNVPRSIRIKDVLMACSRVKHKRITDKKRINIKG